MTRVQQTWFAGLFLALIYSVPLLQCAIEAAGGHTPQFLDVLARTPTRENLRAYEKQMEDDSVVARTVRPWVQYSQFVLLGDAGDKVLPGRNGWLFYKPDVRYLVEPHASDAFRAIVDFRDQLAARGIHLMVMPTPGKPSIYGDRLTARLNGGVVDSPTREMISRLRAAGIEVLDLFALFATREHGAAAPLYLQRDTHWSAGAASLAAGMVAARLKALGWTSDGSRGYEVRPVRVRRASDILKMTQAPLIEKFFPAEEVSCGQVVEAASGRPYRDDPAADVLVIGDSFLRMYQTDEPRSAGFIAHLAYNLRQPLASLVNDGGASTLVRQEMARRPQLLRGKKVVVWEFVERDIRFGIDGWKIVPLPGVYAGAFP